MASPAARLVSRRSATGWSYAASKGPRPCRRSKRRTRMDAEMVDVLIVGAGPAGLAAAIEARAWGLSVALLDEQSAPGGQIYRGVDAASATSRAVLGEDYTAGAALTRAFSSCGAHHVAG